MHILRSTGATDTFNIDADTVIEWRKVIENSAHIVTFSND